MAEKPNILWIMTDQHRADCLGCMGHPVIQTPNLDRLARKSVVFENAFCQSPVCMSSRASVFTGRYPTTCRVRGMGILPPQEVTFPEVLRRNGYHTGAFGKLHLTPEQYTVNQLKSDIPILDWRRYAEDAALVPIVDDPMKENYGFETHVGYEDCLKGEFHKWLRKNQPDLLDKKIESFSPEGPGDLWVSPYPSAYHPSTFIASQAEHYIRSQQGDKPWFSFCSFVAPHHPFEAPLDQIERYDETSIPLADEKGGFDPLSIPPFPTDKASWQLDQWSTFPQQIQRRIIWHYLASISLIDDNIGKLLATLEETGQAENTIIIFTADHGEHLGNHGLFRKSSVHYDETIRVPLIISFPGLGQGRRVSDMVELTDVHPTLLNLADIPVNPGVQGISWANQLRNNQELGRKDIYSDMFDITPQRFGKFHGPYCATQTLRTTKWKLNIYPGTDSKYGQLFDLENDPGETTNLYRKAEYRHIREELLWQMNSRVQQITDPLPYYLTQY